jgi:hypothetical protein
VSLLRLYLDVETYRPRKEDAFINEEVIAIGVIEDWTRYDPESTSIKCEESEASGVGCVLRFFMIWGNNNDEGELVRSFYKYFMKVIMEVKNRAGIRKNRIIVVGFNVLRYDIPLLIQKGFEHKVDSLDRLNALWHDTFVIDYLQTTLPFNRMKFKDLRLERMVELARKASLNVEELHGSGEDVVKWYVEGHYDDIIEHLRRDLETVRVIDLNFRKFYSTLVKALESQ